MEVLADWIRRHDGAENPLIPAATVVLIRDGPAGTGLETLMMRRNAGLSFAEGMWVFPGGRIDVADRTAGADDEAAAVAAAVREAQEEAGLVVDPATLVPLSNWIPPMEAPKRFSTWFFLAPAPVGDVTIDQGEITEHDWCRPADVLDRHAAGLLEMLPPTWITLEQLAGHPDVASAVAAVSAAGPGRYATRIIHTVDGLASVWEGDAGYVNGDPDARPRHRLVLQKGAWRLERD